MAAAGRARGWRGEDGFSLVEMLCATAMLTLLGLLLNSGIALAAKSYRTMIARSETQTLLSTAAAALTDEMRCARDVEGGTGTNSLKYRSEKFGVKVELQLQDGKIVLKPVVPDASPTPEAIPLLPGGTGGVYRGDAYQIKELTVSRDYDKNLFQVTIKVQWKEDAAVSAETTFSVHTLTPMPLSLSE